MNGSAAEREGLRNNDLVLNSIDINALRNDENLTVKLEIKRGDRILAIEYLPRGESVPGFKWVRVLDAPKDE